MSYSPKHILSFLMISMTPHVLYAAAPAQPAQIPQCKRCPNTLTRRQVDELREGLLDINGVKYVAVDVRQLPTGFNIQRYTFSAGCKKEEVTKSGNKRYFHCTYGYTVMGLGPSYQFTIRETEPVLTLSERLEQVRQELEVTPNPTAGKNMQRMEKKYYKQHMALCNDLFQQYPFNPEAAPSPEMTNTALQALFVDGGQYGPVDLSNPPMALKQAVIDNYKLLKILSAPRVIGNRTYENEYKIMEYARPAYEYLRRQWNLPEEAAL